MTKNNPQADNLSHMTKSTFWLVLSLLIPSLAIAQGGKYVLHGNIRSFTQGKAYLIYQDDLTHTIDSANVQNGAFSLSGTVREPARVRLYVTRASAHFSAGYIPSLKMYIEPGNIQLTSPDSLANTEVV